MQSRDTHPLLARDASSRERASDSSWTVWLKDKFLPPLVVAAICAACAGSIAAYKKLDAVASSIEAQAEEIAGLEERIARAEGDVVVLRSESVHWEVLRRLADNLAAYAMNGKGHEAMEAMSRALKAETEAQRVKTK